MLLDGYQEFLIRVAARSSEGLNLQIKTDKIEKRMYNKRQRNDSNRKENGFMLSSKKLEDAPVLTYMSMANSASLLLLT